MNTLLHQLADSEAESGYEANAMTLRAAAGLLERLAAVKHEDFDIEHDEVTLQIAPLILKARELTKEQAHGTTKED